MNEETEAKVKIGLLAVIAITLIINTYYQATSVAKPSYEAAQTPSVSNSNQQMMPPSQSNPGNQGQPIKLQKQNGNNNFSTTIPPTSNTPPPPSNRPVTNMAFETYDHDYGTIPQNSTNTYTFNFTNTGKNPLIIDNAKGSCGCTVPSWPKQPVLPGQTSKITVTYKPGMKQNQQNNTVTITANTDPPTTILRTKATVEPEK